MSRNAQNKLPWHQSFTQLNKGAQMSTNNRGQQSSRKLNKSQEISP
jgi:hypothetical protein